MLQLSNVAELNVWQVDTPLVSSVHLTKAVAVLFREREEGRGEWGGESGEG